MATVEFGPRFSPDQARELARRHFGLEANARELASERDQNFLMTAGDGTNSVLKIANPAEDPAILDLQNQAMLHLARKADAPSCSRIRTDLEGRLMTPIRANDGRPTFLRLVSYLEGVPLGVINPQTPGLLYDLGRFIGRLAAGLSDFKHPAADRDLIWDMRHGLETAARCSKLISDDGRRSLVETLLGRYDAGLRARIEALEKSVIHNDGNDHNVIVSRPSAEPESFGQRSVVGIIDFGDMVRSYALAEPAVACAYVMLGKNDPLAAAARVVAGYHSVRPLGDDEFELIFPLIRLRLIMSVAICAYQTRLAPGNEYLKISNAPAWPLLEWLERVPPAFAAAVFRQAAGLPPCPGARAVVEWLRACGGEFAPVTGTPSSAAGATVFDLSVGSPLIPDPDVLRDPRAFTELLFGEMRRNGSPVGVGRYDEARLVHPDRTVHLGLDLFLEPGTPIFAPLDGTVRGVCPGDDRSDHGPAVILEHRVDGGRLTFHTLYGHLSASSLEGLAEGRPFLKGERLAAVGPFPENGGGPPRLHFQIILDMLGRKGDFPGSCRPGEREVWLGFCPDPELVLGAFDHGRAGREPAKSEILEARKALIGRSLSVSYRTPLKIVRGFRQHLYDETGRAYLDSVNNVPHVGHSHPRVVEAVRRQLAVLNTNTRYLHENLVRYARRLTAKLPPPLRVCYFVNSGSEANDLALRLARTFTGRRDMIVVDGAYHGNLTSLIEISPYKFDGPGGAGRPPFTWKVVMPDPYRGPYRSADTAAGARYVGHVREAVERIGAEGRGPAGFISESLLSCGGQIVPPDGYLAGAYTAVRDAGGLCIADEVQVGFGRVGTHFWGFETQGVVPDIVTMGKPIGNGFPLGAVVTTPEISDAFANGMEYFNTYGGNPVACAAGLAVLDVMEDENLQENAARVGTELISGLRGLGERHALVGDARGLGLFLGIELVLDRATRTPAPLQAAYVAERLREEGILMSTDGPDHNVLKIKPPLVFTEADAERVVGALDKILAEDPARP